MASHASKNVLLVSCDSETCGSRLVGSRELRKADTKMTSTFVQSIGKKNQ